MIRAEDVRTIAEARLEDASILLASGRYDGATYLCGYAVELALKARICETLNWPGYPSTTAEFHDYRSFQTHDLDVLLHLTGREEFIRTSFLTDWSVVVKWNPDARYQVIGTTKEPAARLMISVADMKPMVEKLIRAEREMAAEKGAFLLFALFLRENAPNVWDLVISSPWVVSDEAAALQYVFDKISLVLEPRELVKLSRIALIEPENLDLDPIQETISVEHGAVEVKDFDFLGQRIERGYVITSRREADAKSPDPATRAR